jgi:hypothetical protein
MFSQFPFPVIVHAAGTHPIWILAALVLCRVILPVSRMARHGLTLSAPYPDHSPQACRVQIRRPAAH